MWATISKLSNVKGGRGREVEMVVGVVFAWGVPDAGGGRGAAAPAPAWGAPAEGGRGDAGGGWGDVIKGVCGGKAEYIVPSLETADASERGR